MRIAESPNVFRQFLVDRGRTPETMLPREILTLGLEFYETVRATDALPITEAEFGDALLFQWGIAEALLPHQDAFFYFDLTRQFVSVEGEDDDAMFQLKLQLQYPVTDALSLIGTENRWCGSLEALPGFKAFCFSHPSLAALDGLSPEQVEFGFSEV
jgi:hypothetical protein